MSTPAPAATEQTLYMFPSSGSTGCYPDGTLIRDAAGALYGASLICGRYNQGTIFKLSPPSPGQTKWSISLLYVFRGGNDGGVPSASLVMDIGGSR